MTEQVVIVCPSGVARLQEEAERIAAIKARGAVPVQCGDAIPDAPARGAFRVFTPMQLCPVGSEGYEAQPAGYRGRSAIRNADVFDVMAAKAASKGKPPPFSPGQVSMARHYRDLVERHQCAGLRCSSVEALRSGGDGQGGGFMDAVLRDRDEIDRLRRRVGTGCAIEVRRVRPSKRGSRVSITNRRLVDMVCIEDRSLRDVLQFHGWSVYGETIKAVRVALGGVLDAMAGPVRGGGIQAFNKGA
ncbi:hypothetical protein PXK58_00840 [Phaeobacter gallaeciensis]|uniref:hypothetical protein n=1 Tax=Phaeobacter gallaeciensis TaxID=60890 RepID=UPI002380610F|nr:hypothetical protein [Phaeobacter gallaeciensis]MDE4272968.1 hypothetical protein [Phaeobacter gallaeciensis]MDE4298079.1 hypothetical protein [Phaeobacter gallaeciensis]MDE5183267.1 hypothetical protein [Phaeobacter gallaeciensis]